jgi:hypothetical protein
MVDIHIIAIAIVVATCSLPQMPLCILASISSCGFLIVCAHIHALCPQFRTCLLYLSHQLLVRIWNVVEGKDSPAELEEEICAEGNKGPERELDRFSWILNLEH